MNIGGQNTSEMMHGTGISDQSKESLCIALLLLGILLVFFSKALKPDMILSPSDRIFSSPFFSENRPPDFISPSNPLLFDQVYQFTPWRYFSWKSLRDFSIPLWNPHNLSGTPLIATMQSAVFYPINLILSLLPFQSSFVYSAILRLWIAGMLTYQLSRRYGLYPIPSMIASVSYMLAGFQIVWLGHPHTNVSIWLPALILLAENMAESEYPPNKIIYSSVILSLVIGIQFTGGHIETSADILFAFGCYHIIRWFQINRHKQFDILGKIKRLFIPLPAVVLGCMLAAVQLLPFAEWLFLSAEYHNRIDRAFPLVDISFLKETPALLSFVFPNIYNNPTWEPPYWSFLFNRSNYNELILYVGTLTLLFALIGVCKKDSLHRHIINTLIFISILCMGRAMHWPVFDWINYLPIISLGQPARLRLISSFGLCILSAFGAQFLLYSESETRRQTEQLWLRLCAAVIVLGVLLMIAGNIALPMAKDKILSYGRHLAEIKHAQMSNPIPIEIYYSRIEQILKNLMTAFNVANIGMYSPIVWAIFGFLMIAWLTKYRSACQGIVKIALLAVVVADMLFFGRGYNPVMNSTYFYPKNPILSDIETDKSLFRVTSLNKVLIPDAQMMFDLSDIQGMEFPTKWYDRYMKLVDEKIAWLHYSTVFSSVKSPFLRVLNLKYVIASADDAIADEKFGIIRKRGNLILGKLKDVQPRAFLVNHAVIAENDEKAFDLLRKNPEAVYRRLILSDAKNMPELTDSGDEKTRDSEVSVLDYSPKQSAWKVRSKKNAYLFVSDAYYPGWKAYLDGKPVKIGRANIAFRAVFIPEGDHIVTFQYEPTSLQIGLYISLISLLICSISLRIVLKKTKEETCWQKY